METLLTIRIVKGNDVKNYQFVDSRDLLVIKGAEEECVNIGDSYVDENNVLHVRVSSEPEGFKIIKGEKGDTGEKGPLGDALTFEDLTEDLINALKADLIPHFKIVNGSLLVYFENESDFKDLGAVALTNNYTINLSIKDSKEACINPGDAYIDENGVLQIKLGDGSFKAVNIKGANGLTPILCVTEDNMLQYTYAIDEEDPYFISLFDLNSLKGDKGDKGDQGILGIKGDKGDQGLQGIQGVKGDTGADGSTWFTGTSISVDNSSLIVNGSKKDDFYLNTLTLDVYRFNGNNWKKSCSLKANVECECSAKLEALELRIAVLEAYHDGPVVSTTYPVNLYLDKSAAKDAIFSYKGVAGDNWHLGSETAPSKSSAFETAGKDINLFTNFVAGDWCLGWEIYDSENHKIDFWPKDLTEAEMDRNFCSITTKALEMNYTIKVIGTNAITVSINGTPVAPSSVTVLRSSNSLKAILNQSVLPETVNNIPEGLRWDGRWKDEETGAIVTDFQFTKSVNLVPNFVDIPESVSYLIYKGATYWSPDDEDTLFNPINKVDDSDVIISETFTEIPYSTTIMGLSELEYLLASNQLKEEKPFGDKGYCWFVAISEDDNLKVSTWLNHSSTELTPEFKTKLIGGYDVYYVDVQTPAVPDFDITIINK